MSGSARFADYDAFAWFYNRYWHRMSDRFEPVLKHFVIRHLPPGAGVLDLCCGTGRVAQILSGAGLRVTGLDGSAEMLEFARSNAPDAHKSNWNGWFSVVQDGPSVRRIEGIRP